MIRTRAASVATVLMVLLAAGGDSAAAGSPAIARLASHGSRAVKKIALTFDDGASPENCRRILAELVDARVPATFFPMANAMRLDPAFWRLVATAGYPIGDHTVSHPHMPRLGYTAQLQQLTKSRAVIESLIGRSMLNVFRPPYGEYNGTTRAAAAAAGFPTLLLWDTSDRDTSRHGTVAQMLAAAERGRNGSVVLLHCGPNATPYLLPDLIAFYRRRGFRFVTVPELLGLTWTLGRTTAPSQGEILGSLSPLPPSPFGGSLVDIAGKTPPAASARPGSPTASASPNASVMPSPSSSSQPSHAPPGPTASPAGESAEGSGSSGPVWAAVGLSLLVLLTVIAGIVRRGRP